MTKSAKPDSPGPQLVVRAPTGSALVLDSLGGLGELSDEDRRTWAKGNLLPSKHVYVGELKTSAGELVAAIPGWRYEDGPGFWLVTLGHDGRPKMALTLDRFHPLELTDSDHDGLLELAGVADLGEAFGECLTTYDPRQVFAPRRGGGFAYSARLSKVYTIAHLGGWAGPKSRRDVAVKGCDPKHPHGRLVRIGKNDEVRGPYAA